MIQYKNTVCVVKYYAKNESATNPSTVNTQNHKVYHQELIKNINSIKNPDKRF